KCAAPYLEHTGFGTEKVEHHLRDRFPDARIGRIDRDSVRRKGALASLLSQFAAAELDLLVGTQMIAKGHDFPGVTLVGVISADVGLGLADFRAAERTFQLLTQVAGRAGRGERPGEAVIQTLYPEHYSVLLACRQDYPGFFDKEIHFRRGMRYPPLVAMVNSVVRGRSFAEAMQTAAELVRRLEARNEMTDLNGALAEEITEMLGEPGTLNLAGSPSVILVVGVNGTGKTTTIGKLAHKLREHGRSVLLGAADTWRAAAEEQLEIWAQRAEADFVGSPRGADPAAVAFDAVEAARARGHDVAIIDTAGRLHTQANLMAELEKVRRVIGTRVEGAPHETLLV
ncbi:MAG TPA: AAA family ATPase, partial [Steroidobacteraceae bacterium]|nr:AAA family ATPase [Steroidobacteraceae bacterium]